MFNLPREYFLYYRTVCGLVAWTLALSPAQAEDIMGPPAPYHLPAGGTAPDATSEAPEDYPEDFSRPLQPDATPVAHNAFGEEEEIYYPPSSSPEKFQTPPPSP